MAFRLCAIPALHVAAWDRKHSEIELLIAEKADVNSMEPTVCD